MEEELMPPTIDDLIDEIENTVAFLISVRGMSARGVKTVVNRARRTGKARKLAPPSFRIATDDDLLHDLEIAVVAAGRQVRRINGAVRRGILSAG